ncbi:MAG: protease modulator HflC [Treponema sp.]|jgi:membrane protease subunit HflC|nr:protease modulator HflC [Treponema sp.]
MSKIYKLLFVLIFLILVVAAGFTFTVKEGFSAIVSRFGKIAGVYTEAGLHLKLPWPVDKVITYDTRNQYMDSGYNETLTNDKINIILQTYIVWRIGDIQKFHTSIGNYDAAQRHLNDLAATAKNSVLGNYPLSSLVSTNLEEIKIDEICQVIEEMTAQSALANYGIEIQELKIKRLALPSANIGSVFNQMIADRQKYVSQYVAEAERDSAIIRAEADARAAEIFAQGKLEASEIDAETERMIAKIYGDAYDRNSNLFVFLKKLIALENSVNQDTTVIMRANESPFDIITGKY